MFEGKAEEATQFYVSLFPDAEIVETPRYAAREPGPEGSIKKAAFTIGGQTVLCTDSFVLPPPPYSLHAATISCAQGRKLTAESLRAAHCAVGFLKRVWAIGAAGAIQEDHSVRVEDAG
jgi:predicted 3-demethylubiquinone-9 3-methyltransferase (glyoxalase superfamily)